MHGKEGEVKDPRRSGWESQDPAFRRFEKKKEPRQPEEKKKKVIREGAGARNNSISS